MINPQLLDYVRQQLAAGISKEEISKTLLVNNWQPADVNEAFASISNPPSVPQPVQQVQPVATPIQNVGGALIPIGQLFRDSWNLYKQRLPVLLAVLFIPYLFLFVGQMFYPATKNPLPYLLVYGFPSGNIIAPVASLIFTLLGILLLIPTVSAAIFAISKGTGFIDSFRQGIRLFFPLLWCGILFELVVMGGTIMFIIPGMMMVIWFFLTFFTLVIENKRGLNALLQSHEYVRGYWWAILGRLLLLYVVVFIPIAILQLLIFLVLGKTAGMITYYLISILLTPFFLAYSYKIYQNLTVLKPTLATTTPTSGRGFLIASGTLALLAYIVCLVIVPISLVAFNRARTLAKETLAKSELSSATSTEASTALTTTPYTNTTYGFGITLPTGWQTNPNPKVGIVSFLDTNTPEGDMPYILVQLVPKNNLSLEAYANSIAAQSKSAQNVQSFGSSKATCASACYLIEQKVITGTTDPIHQLILVTQASDGRFFVVAGQSADGVWSTYAATIKNALLSFTY